MYSSKWQLIKCLFGFHKKSIGIPRDLNSLNYIECRYCKKYLGELPDEYHNAERSDAKVSEKV